MNNQKRFDSFSIFPKYAFRMQQSQITIDNQLYICANSFLVGNISMVLYYKLSHMSRFVNL